MWSRNGWPVDTVARPVPRVSSQRIVVSFVSRTTTVIERSRAEKVRRTEASESFAELARDDDGIERAGVERHPDHCSGEATMLERAEVLHRRHAARRVDGKARCLHDVLHQREIGATELSLLVHRGHEEPTERQTTELFDDVEDVDGQRVRPATGRHAAL